MSMPWVGEVIFKFIIEARISSFQLKSKKTMMQVEYIIKVFNIIIKARLFRHTVHWCLKYQCDILTLN